MNKKENPWLNIAFNIILPVVILNYASQTVPVLTPLHTLLIALSFPIVYGLLDYINNKHKNLLSIIGVLNTLLTGGFALFTLDGFWFAVKEAAIPFTLGVGVLISLFTNTPLMKWFVHRSSIFRVEVILSRLDSELKKQHYENLIKKSTLYLSCCFFLSSILNFILARRIFKNTLPQNSSLTDHQIMLNEQIADMTWVSFLVIGVPLTVISVWTMWWFMSEVKKLTSLSLEEVMNMEFQKKKETQ